MGQAGKSELEVMCVKRCSAQAWLTEDAGTQARRRRAITMAQLEGMAIKPSQKFKKWG